MHQLMRFRDKDGGARAAILGEPGYKYTAMVWIDAPVRMHKIPNDIARGASSDIHRPPTLKSAAMTMLSAGKSLGITKAAQRFLREVINNAK